jgi:hypothetical protein
MTFDSTKPDGGAPIAQGDNDIRDNQDAVLAALAGEHVFVDQDEPQQTGKHRFQVDTDAELLNAPTGGAPVAGSIAFSTDQRTGHNVLVVWDVNADPDPAWVPVDVNPIPNTLPRLDENHNWTASQNATWLPVTKTPGSTDTIHGDMLRSPYRTALIENDTLIANPTVENMPTVGDGTILSMDLTIDGTGPHVITFGAMYVAQGGLVQIASGAGERTMLTFALLVDETPFRKIVVTSLPNYNVGSVTASGQIL